MTPAAILALLTVVQTIIQDTPQAVALFETIKGMFANGTGPTPGQWAALTSGEVADHAALMAALQAAA